MMETRYDGASTTGYWRLHSDTLYELLANPRRRECIRLLRESDERRVPVRTLADRVAEALTGDETPDTDVRQSIYISLTQTHLSRLDDHGVVEYDSEQQVVGPGPHLDDLSPFLVQDANPSPNVPSVVVLGLLAVGALVFGVRVLGGGPIPLPVAFVLSLLNILSIGVVVRE